MTTRYTVRIPDDLYTRITQAAEHDRRSINSELLWLLEHGLTATTDSASSPA